MTIEVGNLENPQVIRLLEEHLEDMNATSPPESVHALDLSGLKQSDVTFWSYWEDDKALGCAALKRLSSKHGEIKSMRTTELARGKGVARCLLSNLLDYAKQQGITRLSLETGSMAFFTPAHRLYEGFGFQYCGPFSDYSEDPNSKFMTLLLQ